jgi:hypothetical protein
MKAGVAIRHTFLLENAQMQVGLVGGQYIISQNITPNFEGVWYTLVQPHVVC